MIKTFPIKKYQQGFTLLFASLVVSLLLSIGLAIANITLAQLTISTAGRESQEAIYNADTALECALYYQYKGFLDPDTYERVVFFPQDSGDMGILPPMTCAGLSDSDSKSTEKGGVVSTIYRFNMIDEDSSCDQTKPSFFVRVDKSPSDVLSDSYEVRISTRGYNTCDTSNPRRVERGLYAEQIFE